MSTMSLGFAGGVGSFEARFDFRTQPIEEKTSYRKQNNWAKICSFHSMASRNA